MRGSRTVRMKEWRARILMTRQEWCSEGEGEREGRRTRNVYRGYVTVHV